MTNTPSKSEIEKLAAEHLKAFSQFPMGGQVWFEGEVEFARAALARWGTPAGAGAPVAPDFYTACAWYESGGEAGWIPLPGYSNETEHGVRHLVLEAARKEGYKGTAAGRLLELGWEIRPVYLTPQPAPAQAVAVPLTDAQIAEMMRDTWGCASIAPRHALQFARAIERAHGITQKGGD